MKKQSQLIFRNIIWPFIATFFIALFVLVMQFLWKYVDDLAGKGLDWYVIMELLFYACAHLVPLALPLAVLLSSIMAFGSMGENNELIAFKSAGVSLFRLQMKLITAVVLISVGAFLFSNYVLPKANLRFGALLWDIKVKKPAFDIQEGIFYNGIDGYSIRIGKKDSRSEKISDILIYDHSDAGENNIVIKASRGEMKLSPDQTILTARLFNGSRYEEMKNTKNSFRTFPATRTDFKELTIQFDLSNFKFDRSDIELFRGNTKMLNMQELVRKEDSVRRDIGILSRSSGQYLGAYLYISRDTLLSKYKPNKLDFKHDDFIKNFSKNQRASIITRAIANVTSISHLLESPANEMDYYMKTLAGYQIEWHRKLVFSFVIILLFLIGSSTGAIIRKGGLGLPSVVSIALFISFHIISITGEKIAQKFILSPFVGMWLPIFILLPVSIYLVYKSNRDSLLVNQESYMRFLEKLEKIKKYLPKFT